MNITHCIVAMFSGIALGSLFTYLYLIERFQWKLLNELISLNSVINSVEHSKFSSQVETFNIIKAAIKSTFKNLQP